jgi:hypothetical protein
MSPVFKVLLHPAEQQQQDRLLDVIRAVDGRGERLREEGEDVFSFGELVDLSDVGVGDGRLGDASSRFGREQDDVVGEKEGREPSEPSSSSHALVDTDELDTVPRLASVDHVVLHDNLDGTWELTGRSAFGHLLDRDRLLVSEGGEAVLHRDGMRVTVVFRDSDGGGGGRGARSRLVVVGSGVEEGSRGAVMNGIEHLWADEGAYGG